MKILIVCSPEYDFTASQTCEGLHNLKIQDKQNIDFRVTEKSNYSYCYSSGLMHNYYISDKEAVDFGKESDLIILCSNRFVKEHIVEMINKPEKTIYIDGLDEYQFYKEPSHYILYFKREKMRFLNYADNIFPFPMCTENRYFTCHIDGDLDKIYNLDCSKLNFKYNHKNLSVSCMFGKTDKKKIWREWIQQTVSDMNIENSTIKPIYSKSIDKTKFYIDTGKRYHYDYCENLFNSKISIDGLGASGASTSRFWESLANGCCLFTQHIQVEFPDHNFVENEDYISFDDKDDLKDKLNYLLKNENELQIIAENGFKKTIKYHSSKNRVQYLLDKCKEYKII